MIQRIQTIFLLVALTLGALLQFLCIQTLTTSTETLQLCLMPGCLDGKVKSIIYLPMILNALTALLTLVCIFLYNKRKLQMKLCNLLMVLNIMVCGSLFAFNYFLEEGTVDYKLISFFPLINSLMAYLAARNIKKDEELVRSADRIR